MTGRDFTARACAQLDALLAETARTYGEDPAGAGLLAAVSGGPDSVALLHLAAAWAAARRRPLAAAHFNHRLRGAGSDQDAAFCHQLCAGLGVSLSVGDGDCRPLARRRGRGLEEAARHLRLEFLAHVRRERGLTAVATGHHRDDQAETILLRIGRGTGLDGLRGLRPRRGRLIRPLLGATRGEILDYLQAHGLPWREDPTNLDGSNLRSRVRRELLPLFRDIFGSGATLNPARLADLCELDLAHLDALAEAAWRNLAIPPEAGQTVPRLCVGGVLALPAAIARRVLRRWLQASLPADLARVHVVNTLRWLAASQSGTGLDLPGGLRIVRDFDCLGIERPPPPLHGAEAWSVRLEPLDEVPAAVSAPTQDGSAWRLIAAADALAGNLYVRGPRPGDRLQPFGLAGSKKLSDLVQAKRIPRAWRPGLLVVADEEGPLWVIGVIQAERTRVLPTTERAVTIIVERRNRDRDD